MFCIFCILYFATTPHCTNQTIAPPRFLVSSRPTTQPTIFFLLVVAISPNPPLAQQRRKPHRPPPTPAHTPAHNNHKQCILCFKEIFFSFSKLLIRSGTSLSSNSSILSKRWHNSKANSAEMAAASGSSLVSIFITCKFS